ncbi:MAG: OmpA family protein [Pseudomonadota bacterium]
MKKMTLLLLLAALSNIGWTHAGEPLLPQHLQQIEELQRRADKLAFGGVGSNNYYLAKAHTWIDFALSEYHQKDSSGITLEAIKQAEELLGRFDSPHHNISMDTPTQLAGSEYVRADLWDTIADLKHNPKFSCGQRQVAEAEVHLVWAGHEKAESGWSHAQSYARSAENLIYEAQVAITHCGGNVTLTPRSGTVQPDGMVATTGSGQVNTEKYTLASDTLFGFNSAELAAGASARLEQLTNGLKSWRAIESITLVGHSDRFGSDSYNRQLSLQRAEAVKRYFVGQGVAANKIHTGGVGATLPLVECSTQPAKVAQVACLQANRRVEMTLRGIK